VELDDRQTKVVELIVSEISVVVKDRVELKIEDMRRFLKLNEETVYELRQLVEKHATAYARNLEGRVRREVDRKLTISEGDSVEVNGKRVKLTSSTNVEEDGQRDENEKDAGPADISIQITNNSREHPSIYMMVWRGRSGRGGLISSHSVASSPEVDPRWRQTLEAVSDEQLQAYVELVKTRRKKAFVDALLASLTLRLLLSEEQREDVRAWVDENIDAPTRRGSLNSIFKGLPKSSVPSCLSEAQSQQWKQLLTDRNSFALSL
jgi:hypothetical protein